jgi:hypothetical protein
MPKSLKLQDLKVQSFVTTLKQEEEINIRGGLTKITFIQACCAKPTCTDCGDMSTC